MLVNAGACPLSPQSKVHVSPSRCVLFLVRVAVCSCTSMCERTGRRKPEVLRTSWHTARRTTHTTHATTSHSSPRIPLYTSRTTALTHNHTIITMVPLQVLVIITAPACHHSLTTTLYICPPALVPTVLPPTVQSPTLDSASHWQTLSRATKAPHSCHLPTTLCSQPT